MIVYKIDKQPHGRANTKIRDMDAVLREISPSLQTLSKLLDEQGGSISSPTLNAFRADLQQRVSRAISETARIAEDTQRLVSVSDQAGKHLSAIEEHFGAQLRSQQVQNSQTDSQVLV